MQGCEGDVILAKQVLVLAKMIQKLPLGKPTASFTGYWLYALGTSANTVGARKRAAALYSSLFAKGTREHAAVFGGIGL